MSEYQASPLVEGLAFPESPRWHAGYFWFTDQHARQVARVDNQGRLEVVLETEDLPGGLGWMPDGAMLVVFMTRRQIMRWDGSELSLFADLSMFASFHCNDMVVDQVGRVYAGNFGFDLHGGAAVASAELILIDTDGSISVLTNDVIFPNGSVISADNQTLIVAETFAHRLSAFSIKDDGRISDGAVWADLGKRTPDGICLDQEHSIWVASPGTREVIRIHKGGRVVDRCETTGTPYACMLGGEERSTLYLCTSESDDPALARSLKSGRIETATVSIPGAGLP